MSSLQKLKDLKKLCEEYDEDEDQFSQIVKTFFNLKYIDRYGLARSLQVAPATISKWAQVVGPLPRMHREVVRNILRRVNRQIRILKNAEAIKKSKGE